MPNFPIFLSVVMVVKNNAEHLESMLSTITTSLSTLVSDYEVIVIENGSEDSSVATLKKITDQNGLPNIQVFALTKSVDLNTAVWAGIENALGDFVTVINPLIDDIAFLPDMLAHATEGMDVVFAENTNIPKQSWLYRICASIFHAFYKSLSGVSLSREAPYYRVLSRRVVNLILQHPIPAIAYRHLPATGGFAKIKLSYHSPIKSFSQKSLMESIDYGIRLMVSTTKAPMRLVTLLSLFGALSNVLYSFYVIVIAFTKTDVAPGWVTLSLQQAGMFFLISLVLLVLGEYILQTTRLSNEGPAYHIAQEFMSSKMTRHQKLNIEETSFKDTPSSPTHTA